MFAVMVDHKLREHRSKIEYSIAYLFSVLGYSYRILADDEYASVEDIPFMYVSNKKIVEEYLSEHPRGFAICVLHDAIHYNYDNLGKGDIKQLLKSFNIGYEIPYICSRDIVEPISFTCDAKKQRFYVGVFHFDLIGNIYFHLTGKEQDTIKHRDAQKRFSYQQSNFEKYMNYPYLTGMINLVELFLSEGESYLRYPLLKKPLWPGNKQYAIAITHSVDKLTKWNGMRFWESLFYWLRSFWRVQYHLRNFWGLLRYLFDNWEPYWNFDLIAGLEKDNGIQSTFFFGVGDEKQAGVDYELAEPDLKTQKNELESFGHGFGLYLSRESKEAAYQKSTKELSAFTGTTINGARKENFILPEAKETALYQSNGLKWDSSWAMPDLQGYIHGIGYPFYLSLNGYKEGGILEIPVNFSDHALRSDKAAISMDALEERIEDIIDKARKFRSLLVFNFNVCTFEEILLLSEVFRWLMQRLKGDPSVWKARLSEIYSWHEQRESIKIGNERDLVVIEARRDIDDITLYIKGLWRVNDIVERHIQEKEQEELDLFTENTWWQMKDAEVMVTGRMVRLRNVKSGCRIRLETVKFG
ncbi:MAG: hypothetical protein K9M99_03990 [Candidatus Cloacimonetes bacterium]|nr:hypothetical protein [Candidatus Cloacimonadota bacterium]